MDSTGALVAFILLFGIVGLFYWRVKARLNKITKKFTDAGYLPQHALHFQNSAVGIDGVRKVLMFADASDNPLLQIPLSQVRDYEILKDGISVYRKSGTLGRAVAGGLLLGPLGAILGVTSAGGRSREVTKSAQLKVFTNDFDNPSKTVVIFGEGHTEENKKAYLTRAQLICDKLAIVIDNQKENRIADKDEMLGYG